MNTSAQLGRQDLGLGRTQRDLEMASGRSAWEDTILHLAPAAAAAGAQHQEEERSSSHPRATYDQTQSTSSSHSDNQSQSQARPSLPFLIPTRERAPLTRCPRAQSRRWCRRDGRWGGVSPGVVHYDEEASARPSYLLLPLHTLTQASVNVSLPLRRPPSQRYSQAPS